MKTAAERLEELDAVIDAVLNTGVGQFSDEGQSYTMHDIDKLMRMQQALLARNAAESGTSFRYAAFRGRDK